MRPEWIIAGCGPSLKEVDRNRYRVFALNRAICVLPVVDAFCFAHRLTWEAVKPFLWKTPVIYTGQRFCTDPGEIDTSAFKDLWETAGEKVRILHNHYESLPRKELFDSGRRDAVWGQCTVACAAVCWIARQGQTVIPTVGIDGGLGVAASVEPFIANRLQLHGKGKYDKGMSHLGAICKTLGVKLSPM